MTWILLTALAIGVRHAFEADHVGAVATLVTEERRLGPAVGLGLIWGLGHTLAVGAVGIPLLLLRLELPPGAEVVMEALVGLLLVIFGVRAVWQARRGGTPASNGPGTGPGDGGRRLGRPSLPHSRAVGRRPLLSFVMGLAHGLAGTGGAVALVTAFAPSLMAGVAYLLAFGVGNAVGMMAATTLLSVPVLWIRDLHEPVERYVRVAAGVASIAIGLFMWRGLF